MRRLLNIHSPPEALWTFQQSFLLLLLPKSNLLAMWIFKKDYISINCNI